MRCVRIPVLLAVLFIIGCAGAKPAPVPVKPAAEQAAPPAAAPVAALQAEAPKTEAPKAEIPIIQPKPAETEPAATEPEPGSQIHKVWIFESLWSISKKYYGDGSLWPVIYEANKDQIANPSKIFPKQELVIPPKE